MQVEEMQEKVINLAQKYTNQKRFFRLIRKSNIAEKIIKEISEFYGIREDNIELFDNEIEFMFKKESVKLILKKQGNKLKIENIEMTKSIS
ncbi:hypothetical protein SIRV1gp44 [Sulfolobus islandicus rod-shaped virus 1]|uniref:Uncharacterized protein 90 n=1 Tax=Sulfolobus islandicus rod-shaped virus 1 TaxID=157898 RepID=Y90_SIRV1|nr:hypothetical protein SIRV1gp02 [Sulfolobus islandicus rod-shaped virus 1]NP_666632.1 hypothetical protein SIRV1gp44 [Sulfolobus islandicus rod-shaped virus 1]Q8QHP8.1 RecName: Full=Uncharacterized protein 90 [Sulfolobus islandicus rod-shaped virus 1]CAG38822.1 hypothetical protein [Sulfolobus islandicus rudivirus 1 variant XX]CAC93957.1 hypothetical protein [Sulfolobus islandicus rod-shaped virus 1]CAC93999.1 hypothetical protein [Sulfolobus islandicus rod-shaped virus 1]